MSFCGQAFTEWSFAERVALAAPIDEFNGTTLAVDAEEYLTTLLVSPPHREPLLPALGGIPFSLLRRVDDDLEKFAVAKIRLWFIFNGLDLACMDRATTLRASKKATDVLSGAWATYDQGKGEAAVEAFGKACTYRTYHIKRALHAHLHRKGVMTFVAPYSAAAQMAYLERANFVHGCVGSASCLVFGCAKVITRFDWDRLSVPGDKPCCIYVSTEQCMQKLNLTREQFMELCLVSGSSSIIPALPEVEELPMPNMTAARSLLTRCNNDVAALCYSKSEDQYLLQLHKARYAVKFPVISTQEAGVEIYDWKNAPSDSHDFIGQRLPDEVYDYLQRGVIGPRALDWRARHEVLETQPLDGGHSSAYRDLVQKKLAPMRAQTLGLMTHLLNRYYQKKDVELLCWFKETEKKALSIPDHTDAYKPTDSWHVQQSAMPTESTNPDVSPLLYAIRALADDAAAEKTITPRPAGAGHQVREPSEVRANTVWRFLQDRGYLTPEHTLSTWGKALKVAFDQAASNGIMTSDDRRKEIEEAIFIAFELLRLDVLNAENMFPAPPYSGAPMRGSETDKAHTLLISRVACLASFQHDQIGYTGPLSRHTLAYHQMTAAVRGALRDLVEMHATNMFLSGAVKRWRGPQDGGSKVQFSDVGFGLPFVHEPDCGLALVVKSHLDELSNPSAKTWAITAWFNHALDIRADLQKAWKLWDAIHAGVQAADASIVTPQTKKMFHSADQWLQQKRTQAEAPNGTT